MDYQSLVFCPMSKLCKQLVSVSVYIFYKNIVQDRVRRALWCPRRGLTWKSHRIVVLQSLCVIDLLIFPCDFFKYMISAHIMQYRDRFKCDF